MHEQLYREIEGMQDRLAAWRRVLHQIPEVSMDLPNTLAYMKDRLNEMGVGYTQAGRCGLYALLGQGDGTILLCAACGTAVFIFQFVELPIQHRAALAIQISHETRHAKLYKGRKQTVKRAADNKRRYAPGEGSIPPVLLSGVSKGVPPLAHDFACKV